MKINRAKSILVLLLVLFTVVSPLTELSATAATNSAPVWLEKSPSGDVAVGHTISVAVMLSGAQNVAGTSFEISFDPKILEVIDANNSASDGVNVSPGNIFNGLNPTIFQNSTDNKLGKISFTSLLLSGSVDATSTKSIATISFKAIGAGTSNVQFIPGNISDNGVALGQPGGADIPSSPQNNLITVKAVQSLPQPPNNSGGTHPVPQPPDSSGGTSPHPPQPAGNGESSQPPASTQTQIFTDTRGHWAQAEIDYMVSKQIIMATPGSKFRPNDNITRADFAALLARVYNLKYDSSMTNPFKDVNSGMNLYQEIVAAAASGLINGYAGKQFRPNEAISRQQLATMVARAMVKRGNMQSLNAIEVKAALAGFGDTGSISINLRSDVALAVKQGIVKGITINKLAPNAQATRAQAVVMLKRLMDKMN